LARLVDFLGKQLSAVYRLNQMLLVLVVFEVAVRSHCPHIDDRYTRLVARLVAVNTLTNTGST